MITRHSKTESIKEPAPNKYLVKVQTVDQRSLRYLSDRRYQRLSAAESSGCGQFCGQNYPVSSEPNQTDWHSFLGKKWTPLQGNSFSQQQWHTAWPGSVALCKMKHN